MIHEYRGFLIKPHNGSPTLYVVSTAGKGGKIPAVLEGLFTSVGIVKSLIDKYEQNKPAKKDKEDAETRSKSGD